MKEATSWLKRRLLALGALLGSGDVSRLRDNSWLREVASRLRRTLSDHKAPFGSQGASQFREAHLG